jgi:hypothetical protein
VKREKRGLTEKAKKELEQHIFREAHVRGDFHRSLESWLELFKPSSTDVAELNRMYTLDDQRLLERGTDKRD